METESVWTSRFSTKPRGRSVPPHQLKKSELRLNVLKSLAHDRFLCADYLGALNGTSYTYMLDVLAILKEEPHAYVRICDEQSEPNARKLHLHDKLQYELTPLGAQVVFDEFGIRSRQLGRPPSELQRIQRRHYEHQIMGDHAYASFRIGVAESDGRFALLTFEELLQHPKTPEATRAHAVPNIIPLGGTIKNRQGKTVPHVMETDREAFLLRDLTKGMAYFFIATEVGTGSETHKQTQGVHDHSRTAGKFEDCLTILQKRVHESYFGAPKCFFLFLEPNLNRIKHMMTEELLPMTTRMPWARASFRFKVQNSYTEKYTASGRMLTEPFHMLGVDGKTTTFSLVQ